MKDIGIFGTSGFAREVADIAWELGYRVVLVARDQVEASNAFTVDEIMLEEEVASQKRMMFAIAVGDNHLRQKIASRYRATLQFTTLIHPSATFGRGQKTAVEAQAGVIVCAGVRFTNNIQVGDFSVFNQNSTIAHDVIIEDFVNVAPGACISGNVHLGARCWIGTGAVINQGNNEAKLLVGSDTVIGSGAAVVENCDANAVYVGVPAKRIK